MPIFRRKSTWQRLSEQLATGSKPALKAGAAAAAGAALTAASAAISAYRRKTTP